MDKPSRVSVVALVVAVLALVATFGGVADAAKHKIGKNLVVTKSIKNGAVTGKKVRDRSLTAVDLAPGTIPAPGNGTHVVSATATDISVSPNEETLFAPSGPSAAGDWHYAVAPVAISVGDFVAASFTQWAGNSVTVRLVVNDQMSNVPTPVLSCTMATGASTCRSDQRATIPAGAYYALQTRGGPGGAGWGFISVGYTAKVL